MNNKLIDKIIDWNYGEFGKEFGDTLVDLKNENERLNNTIDKTNWWLNEMLRLSTNDETKAIINGALELLLKGDNK